MDKNVDTALTELVVKTCTAVRQGLAEEAQASFAQLLALAAEGNEAGLLQVETCLLTAARAKQIGLLQDWLQAVKPLVWAKQQNAAEGKDNVSVLPGELLLKLTFAISDKRLATLEPTLQALWHSWLGQHNNTVSFVEQQRLCGELLNLAARMARRSWHSEARFLLRIVAWALLHQRDLKLSQKIMAQLALHFTVYARWESFSKACEVYHELVLLLVLLVRRAGRASLDQAKRAAYLQLALRTVRDIVTNIARSTMQEDMDIFRQWYQYLWQLAGEDGKRKQSLLLLLQLSIRYWQNTLPKSSKKQLRFLEDLLQPLLISKEYEELLNVII